MFRHWLRFVQPLALSFLVFAVVTHGFAQETPDSPSPPPESAATAADESPPPTEAEEPATESPAAEVEPAPPPGETPPGETPPAETPPAETPPAETPPAGPMPPEEPVPAAAQEAPKSEAEAKPGPEPESPAEPAEATEPKPEPKPETAAEASDSAAVFAAKLAEWKELLKDLRRIRIEYRTAMPDQAAGVAAKWTETVARADVLIEALREAGKAAYLAAPNADEALTEFLVQLVGDDVARDSYEPAVDLARALLDNGCDKKELFNLAGLAAFATNDFDAAETWSQRAQSAGTLSDTAAQNMASIAAYKKYWEEEQQIRRKEAEQNDLPRIRLNTSKGEMVVELFENEAPEAVGNFVSLVERKFYDDLPFHRVLPAFMAQGGCPRGDGTGDPGYKIYCECKQDNHRKHFRGTLSMAHAGPNTGGSQFFITFVPTPHLNGQHTAFGRVVEGMEVLAKLQRIDPSKDDSAPILDKIITAEVIRKRDHEYQPRKVEKTP